MFKNFIIKIFRLTDISNKLIEAREKQKKSDTKYWKNKLREVEERLERDYNMDLDDYKAQIYILEKEAIEYNKRNSLLNKKEYEIKKQTKNNTFISTKLSSKLDEFGEAVIKIVKEFEGLKDEMIKSQKKIESK